METNPRDGALAFLNDLNRGRFLLQFAEELKALAEAVRIKLDYGVAHRRARRSVRRPWRVAGAMRTADIIGRWGWLVAPAAFALLGAVAATAQEFCGNRADIMAGLADSYGESSVGAGVLNGGHLLFEVAANPETGSWTALSVNANGVACVVAANQGWQTRAPAPDEEGL